MKHNTISERDVGANITVKACFIQEASNMNAHGTAKPYFLITIAKDYGTFRN